MEFVQSFFVRDLAANMSRDDQESLRRASNVAMVVGILLVVAGVYALYRVFAATFASVFILGGFLLVGGIFHGINAFSARKWTAALFDVLACAIYIISGIVAFREPLLTATAATLVLAVMFSFQGIARAVASVTLRPPQWGWMLFNGLITLFLGVIVFMQWPASSLWLLGVMIGVDMLLAGWTMLLSGATVHRAARRLSDDYPSTLSPAPV